MDATFLIPPNHHFSALNYITWLLERPLLGEVDSGPRNPTPLVGHRRSAALLLLITVPPVIQHLATVDLAI